MDSDVVVFFLLTNRDRDVKRHAKTIYHQVLQDYVLASV